MNTQENRRVPETAATPSAGPREPETGVGVLDVLLVLASRKKTISRITAAGTILGAVVAFLLPNIYTATAVIMPPQQQQSTASALLAQLGPLTGAASTLGLKNPADLYVGLLGSRTIADHIIDRFQLSEVYKARTRMDARETLRSRTQLSSGKDTLIKISVDDTDSRRAAEIANMYVSELNNLNSGMASSDAAQRRQFLERRLKEEKDALSVAEEQMKQKQVNTGVFHLEGQAQVAIAAVAQLRAQIAAEEIALQRLSMGATAENPEVMRTRTEISALRSQLSNLERSSRRDLGDPLLRTSTIPTATLEYVRGVRDLKYHETLFELLSKQYEAARIDEAKAAPELGLVDAAVAPEKKSSPHRLLLILFSFAGSGIFATALAAFMSRLSNDQDARRLRSLKSSLRTW